MPALERIPTVEIAVLLGMWKEPAQHLKQSQGVLTSIRVDSSAYLSTQGFGNMALWPFG